MDYVRRQTCWIKSINRKHALHSPPLHTEARGFGIPRMHGEAPQCRGLWALLSAVPGIASPTPVTDLKGESAL